MLFIIDFQISRKKNQQKTLIFWKKIWSSICPYFSLSWEILRQKNILRRSLLISFFQSSYQRLRVYLHAENKFSKRKALIKLWKEAWGLYLSLLQIEFSRIKIMIYFSSLIKVLKLDESFFLIPWELLIKEMRKTRTKFFLSYALLSQESKGGSDWQIVS